MTGIIIDKDVDVRARDGIVLATDVYRPSGEGRWPTLILRTPYGKERFEQMNVSFDILRGVRAGYVVVAQDVRGRYASEGEFYPFTAEASDGADTIEWAAAQEWSTGTVGLIGASYFGATQWTAAAAGLSAVKAIAPMITPDQYFDGWAYQNGAFQLGFNLFWTLGSVVSGELGRGVAAGRIDARRVAEHLESVDHIDALYARYPISAQPEIVDVAPHYFDWLAHPSYDAYWKSTAPKEAYEHIEVPALNIGGWYDIFLKGTLANYVGMKARGGSSDARSEQRLIIGPWAHATNDGSFPELGFGVSSGVNAVDVTGRQLRWFDWLLKGEQNGVATEKPVRLFVMGSNTWVEADDWPLPGTEYVDFYLHSGGDANTLSGDGVLSTLRPVDEPPDVFASDPANPVPTVGGPTLMAGASVSANAGPRDQREVEGREDVLCYTTEALTSPVEVIGPVHLKLWFKTTVPDTDFAAKLVDVFPDGRAFNVAEGIQRVRYRNSECEPTFLEPGTEYEVVVDLVGTACSFGVGHRIRLEVSGSNFPRFDRNSNTGGDIYGEPWSDVRVARNHVLHSGEFCSRLILPVQKP
ncbi:CocE/NonD family hydrolase [Rhodococcus opacus]|uniref:CocE/NonD family hydrolase n=1 Tax=Rhodococcus opacus TaxID=37919 RepID=UPI00247721BD|nr:CocE/NonD family hydrolase [Rhodococcus opacus]